MRYCSKCGKEIHEEAVVCVHCGCAVAENTPKYPWEKPMTDGVNPGLCILSALFPLFGIIFWALMYSKTPKKARACGISAIISGVVMILIYILLMSAVLFLPILFRS